VTANTVTDRSSMDWKPRPSPGGRLAGGVAAALGLAALVGFALGLTREPGVVALVLLVAALLATVGAVVVGLGAAAHASLRYSLTPNALIIRWLGSEEVVPLEELDGVYSGQRLGRITPIRGFNWPGSVTGTAQHNGRAVEFYATSADPEHLTLLVTERVGYAVSPVDPPTFRQEVIRRLEQGPGSAPPPRPSIARGLATALHNPVNAILLGVGLVLALVVLAQFMVGFERLSAETVLHFNIDGAPDVVGPRANLAEVPLLAIGGWMISALVGLLVAGRSASAAQLLWLGSVAAELVLIVSIFRLAP
jgi:hypothetical protein